MEHKPKVKLIGNDGNAFGIIGAVAKALKKAGLNDKASEFTKKAFTSPSYDAMLTLCMEYVDVV